MDGVSLLTLSHTCPPEAGPLRNGGFIKQKCSSLLNTNWWMATLAPPGTRRHMPPRPQQSPEEPGRGGSAFPPARPRSAGQALVELSSIHQGRPFRPLASKREDRGRLQSPRQPSPTGQTAALAAESAPGPCFLGHRNCWESGEAGRFAGANTRGWPFLGALGSLRTMRAALRLTLESRLPAGGARSARRLAVVCVLTSADGVTASRHPLSFF